MKKLISLVLMILTMTYGALAEDTITFREVPWGVTPSEFQLILWEEGTYFDDLEVFSEEHYSFLKSEVYGSYGVEPRWGSKRLCYYSFYWGEEQDYACIAGTYEIDRLSAQFLPTYSGTKLNYPGLETSQLHQVTYVISSFRQNGKIVDKEVAFYDLIDRLTEVYGEPENNPMLSTPIARYWIADDGTSVIVKPVQFDTKYPAIHIEYRSAIDQDYITGLVEAYNKVDGEFGKNTDKGVKAFQTAAKIEVDGKFGKKSMEALTAYSKPQDEPAKVEPVQPTYSSYVVQSGDSLWKIAKNLLGDGRRWTEIAALNEIENTTIHTGEVLKIPE